MLTPPQDLHFERGQHRNRCKSKLQIQSQDKHEHCAREAQKQNEHFSQRHRQECLGKQSVAHILALATPATTAASRRSRPTDPHPDANKAIVLIGLSAEGMPFQPGHCVCPHAF